MVQTLCFISKSYNDKELFDRIVTWFESDKSEDLVIDDRYLVSYNRAEDMIYIDRTSDEYVKIIACKMPPAVFKNLLNMDYDHMDGFEWIC